MLAGLRNLTDRFSASTAGAAPSLAGFLAFHRNWKSMLQTLDTKISEVQQRRGALVEERDGQVLAAVEGDEEASRRADKLDRHVADAERELARLHAARSKAANRVALEAAAEAANAEQARHDGIAAMTNELHPMADTVGKATTDLAAALRAYGDKLTELRIAADRQPIHDLALELTGTLVNVTKHRLSTEGVGGFSLLPHGVLERARAKLRPGVDFVLAMARAPRR
jgi:hypothetical protein